MYFGDNADQTRAKSYLTFTRLHITTTIDPWYSSMILDFCLEPRGSSQEGFQPLLKNYYNSIRQSTRHVIGRKIRCKKSDMKSGDKVKSPKTTKLGAAFLAVCRGKVTKSNPFICVSTILQLQTHRLCNHVALLKAPILTIKFTYDWPHVHIYSHAKIQIRFHYITTIICLACNRIVSLLSSVLIMEKWCTMTILSVPRQRFVQHKSCPCFHVYFVVLNPNSFMKSC